MDTNRWALAVRRNGLMLFRGPAAGCAARALSAYYAAMTVGAWVPE